MADELFSPDLRDHGLSFGTTVGRDGIKQLVRTIRGGFPDLHFGIEHLMIDGRKLMEYSD